MKNLRNPAVALVIAAMLMSLYVTSWTTLQDKYSVPDFEYTIDGQTTTLNIMEQLNNLNIIEGFTKITEAFRSITSGTEFVSGALISGGIGILKTLLGVFTTPFEISFIVTNYLDIPPIIGFGLVAIFYTYLSYILVSAYTNNEV